MLVLQSTLEKAMARLYKVAVEPYASIVDETELENEWLLIIGLRRRDFHQILGDMKRRRFVIERAHESARWIEFTAEGIAFLRERSGVRPVQEIRDWWTLQRASSRRKLNLSPRSSNMERR